MSATLDDLAQRLERIENKMDTMGSGLHDQTINVAVIQKSIESLSQGETRSEARIVALEARIAEIDRWRSWIVGIAIGAGTLLGGASGTLAHFLTK